LTYEFIPSFIFADARVLFDSRPADLTVNTDDYEVYNPSSKEYEKAVVQNDFEATLNYFVIDLGVKIKPVSFIPLAVRLGIDYSTAAITKTFSQSRQIIEPAGVLINGKSSETVGEGDFTDVSSNQGLSGSLISDIALSDVITLSPEISYRYPLSSSLSSSDWFTTLIRAGASISIRLNPPEAVVEQRVDTVVVPKTEEPVIVQKEEPPMVEEESVIRGLEIDEMSIKETTVTQTYPILPYVFFDSASSVLKSKYYYKGNTKNFTESGLDKNSIKIYERLLDIIGSRLQSSGSKLLIKGFTDGQELGDIITRSTLAYKRATTVRDYLITKWHISPDRLSIKTEDVPTLPTSTLYKEGLEENRRVELVPEDMNLLKPIVHSQFFEYASDKNEVNVDIDVDAENIKDYALFISDDKNQYYSVSKPTSPEDEVSIKVDEAFLNKVATSDINNLKVELLVTKKDGRLEHKTAKFNVVKEKNDFELGRLNLIVFDFDKSDISEVNKNMIDKFIVNNISANSETEIIGSTDHLGEQDYNMELSQRRADNVAKYINTLLPDAKFKNVIGIGSSNPKFDNSTPEGRFYCRTVLIEVKTPI
jgi:outer membrane protein OmpA-like peptidoglycan-associated protein